MVIIWSARRLSLSAYVMKTLFNSSEATGNTNETVDNQVSKAYRVQTWIQKK